MNETTQDTPAIQSSDPPEARPTVAAKSSRRPWWRRVLILLAIPLLVVLVLLLVILWVLGTQSGLRSTLALVEGLAPELLQVERAEGHILGDLHLEDLRIRLPGVELRFSNLDLRWHPLAALTTGTLRVAELSVRELDIAIVPSEDEEKEEAESGPIELPELPLPQGLELELEQALIGQLGIGTLAEDSRFRIDRIALAASWVDTLVTVKGLTLSLPEPRLTASIQGQVDLTDDYPLRLGLVWNLSQEPALELAGTTTIGGDLGTLHLENDLTGSARAKLRASVLGVLDHLRWVGELKIREVDLPAIQADLPAMDLNGKLTTSGDLDDIRVRGNLIGVAPELPDIGRLQADLDLSWQGQVLDIVALDLTEDQSGALLTAKGELDLSHPAGKVDLEAVWEKLRWPLVGDPIAEARQGALQAQGTLDAFSYQVSAEVWGRDFPAGKLQLTGEGNQEAVQIKNLRIDTLDGKIRAKGQISWSPQPSWNLTLMADGIDPGVQWPQLPARIDLELTSWGNLDAFEYGLEAEMDSKDLPAVTLGLRGRGDGGSTRIEDLHLDTLGGRLRAAADVTWEPALTWDAELAAANIDPGKQWPEWGGNLNGRILSKGKLADGGPDLSAQLTSLTCKLRGYPVDAAARIRVQGTELGLDELHVASGPSQLRVTGSVGERLDLALNLDAPDLESLLPDAQGSIRARGAVTGTLEAPAIRFDHLAAAGVAVAGQSIQSLRGTAQVDLAPNGSLKIELAGQGLEAGGQTFDRLRVQGNGSMGAHRFSTQVVGEPLALDLEVAGGLEADNAYTGRLEGLALRTQEFGNWRLQKAAPITLAGARIKAGPLCIREETSEKAGSGGCVRFEQREAGSWNAALDLDRLAFDLFKGFVPEDLDLTGEVRAKANFKATNGTLTGDAEVRIAKGVLGIPSGGKEGPERLDFTSAQLTVGAGGKGLRARLAVPLKGLGELSANASLPGWTLNEPVHPQQPLQGRVKARVDDLGLISRLVPDITQLTGKLNADFRLGGTLAKPGLDGAARLAGGGLQVPFIGLEVEDLAFDAQAKGLDRIEYRGGFKAGKGRLEIDGHTLIGADGLTTRIGAKGRRLTVADTKEYFALVSPDIQAEIGPTGTKITGRVGVPEARIRPRHIPAGTVSPSPDVVIASEVREEQSPYATSIDLRLLLGQKVTVNAFGLHGTIRGELAVLQEPGKEIMGDGQLEVVDGTYRISVGGALSTAVGTALTIEQGFLSYAKSPIANPYLVLTAQREGGDITAGLRVFGTIKHPKLTFFSATDPGMSQAEVTKYLLTGIPPTRDGEAQQDRTVSLGTYIAPKLFAEYDHSLGDESDKIKLRYDLKDWIELQAETGDAQGGDIFFTIEH